MGISSPSSIPSLLMESRSLMQMTLASLGTLSVTSSLQKPTCCRCSSHRQGALDEDKSDSSCSVQKQQCQQRARDTARAVQQGHMYASALVWTQPSSHKVCPASAGMAMPWPRKQQGWWGRLSGDHLLVVRPEWWGRAVLPSAPMLSMESSWCKRKHCGVRFQQSVTAQTAHSMATKHLCGKLAINNFRLRKRRSHANNALQTTRLLHRSVPCRCS